MEIQPLFKPCLLPQHFILTAVLKPFVSVSQQCHQHQQVTWKLVTPEPGVGLTDVPSSKNSLGPWEPNDGHIAIGSKVKAPAEWQKPKVDHFLGGHTWQIWQRHMTDWK
jgi:hypothetical protein